jgi:hypothetical protein
MLPGRMLAGERRQPSKKFVGLEAVLGKKEEQLSIEVGTKGPGTSGISSISENNIAVRVQSQW